MASAVKTAPGVFVKLNWNPPAGSLASSVKKTAVGAGAMSRMAEVPGMPFANTVTMTQPTGKLVTGRDEKAVADQFSGGRSSVCPPSMERNCTRGKSAGESWEALPPEASERRRHWASQRACAGGRIVEFGGIGDAAGVLGHAAGDEHLAVEQQRGCVVLVFDFERAGIDPGSSVRKLDARQGQHESGEGRHQGK